MAFGLPCYCCGVHAPIDEDSFFCADCLRQLTEMFAKQQGVIAYPAHFDHCIACGQYENRRILYTGAGFFPGVSGAGYPICERCVNAERKKWEQMIK